VFASISDFSREGISIGSLFGGRMDTGAFAESNYTLGHSAQELARLSQQGEISSPFTRQLFEQAGIRLGMSILDRSKGEGGRGSRRAGQSVRQVGACV